MQASRIIASSLALSIATLAGASRPVVIGSCPPPECIPQTADDQIIQQTCRVEVVFVLDTTGSMGGLIEGAKQKIWSIATTIAQAQPSPEIRMGLIGYRDRGDDYITRRTALTEDLDAIYSDLMTFEARGGGDAPESVNQALFEAIERFDWTEGDDTLRIVYLVGDAPPKMEYQDDVKYQASCKLAREKGILINTIQCGSMSATRQFWQEIAQNAGGAYAAIPQDGGVRQIATPYDDQINQLSTELNNLMIDYGDRRTRTAQTVKRAQAAEIADAAPTEANADRAAYLGTASGKVTLYGEQELVVDVTDGKVKVEEIPEDHLPESLRGKSKEEIKTIIAENKAKRDAINARMAELVEQRRAFLREASDSTDDGFDAQVRASIRAQAARIGLLIPEND
ncbi:MAG: VWA domain-containing protein [Planctomycetota bacterium]|nr:MAG: VWA domain-containing protein [Planctomycetota bacterium]